MLHLTEVDFSFQQEEDRVLQSLSFSIGQGERVAIVGKSGSGKSTLAMILKGLYAPTKGTITYGGEQGKDDIALLFQNPDNQMVASLVEDDIAFGLENRAVLPADITKQVEAYAKKLKIAHLCKRPIHQLSGGQKQRVALAGLLVLEPKILVLDEATSMLDPNGRRDVEQLLKILHAEGKTIISITHDVEEVCECTRVLGLAAGELIFDGSPHALFTNAEAADALGFTLPFQYDLEQQLANRGIRLNLEKMCTDEEIREALWRFALKM